MTQQWAAWSEKFNHLSQRERTLIALACAVVIGMLVYIPLESSWKQQLTLQTLLQGYIEVRLILLKVQYSLQTHQKEIIDQEEMKLIYRS